MADSKDMLKVIIDALQDKKAEDIRVIDISNVSVIADYFVIASGSNTNQIQAMVDNVEEEMFKAGFDDPKVEGYNTASWILLDYKDVIVHVFSEDDRAFYNIERIWRDGKEVDINSLYIDNQNPLSLGLGRSGTRFAACSSLPSAGVLKRL